jgi:hypothetical protein
MNSFQFPHKNFNWFRRLAVTALVRSRSPSHAERVVDRKLIHIGCVTCTVTATQTGNIHICCKIARHNLSTFPRLHSRDAKQSDFDFSASFTWGKEGEKKVSRILTVDTQNGALPANDSSSLPPLLEPPNRKKVVPLAQTQKYLLVAPSLLARSLCSRQPASSFALAVCSGTFFRLVRTNLLLLRRNYQYEFTAVLYFASLAFLLPVSRLVHHWFLAHTLTHDSLRSKTVDNS